MISSAQMFDTLSWVTKSGSLSSIYEDNFVFQM